MVLMRAPVFPLLALLICPSKRDVLFILCEQSGNKGGKIMGLFGGEDFALILVLFILLVIVACEC
ncbi:YjcZ family sporulation protein [Brevibacillus nitrificans]|uniref:YjcZ family sporulation protein n=1 Tax=Brevibacillus nitrificans TaxID=651560 RepID=UPI0037C031B7